MKITIFGTGYVGLVTGACLADVGHEVMCVDIDQEKIENLKKGLVTIFEPGIEYLVSENYRAGRLNFTIDTAEAVKYGDLQFIAVGTPPDEDGSADLTYVLDVARAISKFMDSPKIVVNKSTVPVGTAEKVQIEIANTLEKRSVEIPFEVCSNPEFLKEGSAIEDFTKCARIIVGTSSEWVRSSMRECYAPYNRNHEKLMFMDSRSAELTKYAANAMLATKISFMNEMATIAERLGVDIENIRKGIGSDPRIGYHFIYPGCGYGGSCFPKDVRALVMMAGAHKLNPELLKAVESVNRRQKGVLYTKLKSALGGSLKGRTIAVWGLSFKPQTDDMREAPSCTLIESLWRDGAKVKAFDPEAMEEANRIYGSRIDFELVKNREDAVYAADALVICTEWKDFRVVDFHWLKRQLKTAVVIDGRNLYDPDEIKDAGIMYFAIGRAESVLVNTR